MLSLARIIATVGGAGYLPKAPGTAGALVGTIILIAWTQFTGHAHMTAYNLTIGLASLLFFILGVWSANVLEPEWGKDPGKIVVDELVGVWIAGMFVTPTLLHLLLAFVLFRIFDIWKPLGIRHFEKYKGGLGVMLDDVVAGIYACIVLQVIVYFFNI